MASTRINGIRVVPTPVQDKRQPAHVTDTAEDIISIAQYHPSFADIIGPNPSHSLLLTSAQSSNNPLFHAACVYLPSHNELFTTSKPLKSSSSQAPVVLISRINIIEDPESGDISSVEWQKLRPPPNLPMPASGVLVPSNMQPSADHQPKPDTILFCSQGNFADSGGIYLMPRGEPPIPCATSYNGRPFNSPYGAAVHSDWSVWFTDPAIGIEADFREKALLPPQVYRFDPGTNEVRAMADGFQKPVGIAIDDERRMVYVADAGGGNHEPAGQSEAGFSFLQSITGSGQGGQQEVAGTATIYAFDLITVEDAPFLANRRLFAFAGKGVPMYLMCDGAGNVWAACGDGIEIWSRRGSLLGVIQVPGGATSFCRGSKGDLFICSGKRLWNVRLSGGSLR